MTQSVLYTGGVLVTPVTLIIIIKEREKVNFQFPFWMEEKARKLKYIVVSLSFTNFLHVISSPSRSSLGELERERR